MKDTSKHNLSDQHSAIKNKRHTIEQYNTNYTIDNMISNTTAKTHVRFYSSSMSGAL